MAGRIALAPTDDHTSRHATSRCGAAFKAASSAVPPPPFVAAAADVGTGSHRRKLPDHVISSDHSSKSSQAEARARMEVSPRKAGVNSGI